MTPSARLSAAIEVLADIAGRRRPAADALKEWGLAHRFAGSGDRAGIAGLVYDALRRKASAAWLMGEETPRAIVTGMLRLERGLHVGDIDKLFDGSRFAPAPLDNAERAALTERSLDDAPPPVAGDYPDWLDDALARVFGDERAAEGAALARRAPLDLRVNTLKADRDEAFHALSHLGAEPTRWSPFGLRIALPPDARNVAVHAEPAFLAGQVEVQDEGSQLAALLSGAKPGLQVVDLCAGAGGKTLALAALMENHGQIFATDLDKRRLAPIHERLARAGTRNVQVRTPRGPVRRSAQREGGSPQGEGGRGKPQAGDDVLSDLHARADLVLIDAPCTGTGTWRRNPDAKWRMRPGALAERIKEQTALLDRAAALVKPGGRIAYVTCSVLAEENADQVRGFLKSHPDFAVAPPAELLAPLGDRAFIFRQAVLLSEAGVQMTPRRTETDGFFVAVVIRRPH
ncbi:MAG TPA: RsmB/NOP family class I SAM-dependent RNA methyltransferase [Xanthobacteraceae bacterium]|nr:RsmB/NOP family class I SAM-dependent RNA methyltransferase [Xanthobacteraceae bacterium]